MTQLASQQPSLSRDGIPGPNIDLGSIILPQSWLFFKSVKQTKPREVLRMMVQLQPWPKTAPPFSGWARGNQKNLKGRQWITLLSCTLSTALSSLCCPTYSCLAPLPWASIPFGLHFCFPASLSSRGCKTAPESMLMKCIHQQKRDRAKITTCSPCQQGAKPWRWAKALQRVF